MDARLGAGGLTMRRVAPPAAALALLLAGCASTSEPATTALVAGPEGCAAVPASAFGGTSASGKWVAADAAAGLPAYCEVTGTLSPVAGSKIGVVFRLPESWNGKMLGIGGGGWAGNVTLMAASDGLKQGYATVQTDGGHASTSPWENAWAADAEARIDFAWRAVHETAVAGKAMVAAWYGRPHQRAYFNGCSTGGRMGLMEAQRFPGDYDAIVAGAPVYTLQVQTSAVLRTNLFARPGAGFSKADTELVNRAVLAACDADDGLADGLVGNPRQCKWDPGVLQCAAGKTDTCLAPAQVTVLRMIYDGIRAPDGSWAMFPMSRGGEAAWSAFVPVGGEAPNGPNTGGSLTLAPYLFENDEVDYARMTPEQVLLARSSAFAKAYEAGNSNLSPFFAGGGKLLLWHGENDPGPSPVGSNDYAAGVVRNSPAAAASQFRHFLMPGVGHCRGGPGADNVDWLAAIDQWVESGTPPETVIGRNDGSGLVRKHCAWPKSPRYDGSGEANDPANWTCT